MRNDISLYGHWRTLVKSVVTIALSCAVGVASFANSSQAEYRPGEVVAKLKGISTRSLRAQTKSLRRALHGLGAVTVTPLRTDSRYVKIVSHGVSSTEELVARVQSLSQVEYAEPNYVYHATPIQQAPSSNFRNLDFFDGEPLDAGRVPQDPQFGMDWGLLNTGQADKNGQTGTPGSDIGATKAWALGTGSKDIVVAVIDTGVDYNHEDLSENIWTNPNANTASDDDGDANEDTGEAGGAITGDVHGWNFFGKNSDPMDDNGHGTHCSGTIGAIGENNRGTAGVSWNVSIMALKFLSAEGSGSLSDAVDAIRYATQKHVQIMSNSWGGGGYSRALEDAIRDAKNAGVLFVAAAGNDGKNNDSYGSYPANFKLDNIISVAATDNRDQLPTWSDFGGRSVHLAAPGVNIFSTIPGGYDTYSGTSMATPHVSGAAALLWSMNRSWTYREIKARLMSTVDPVAGLRGKVISGGRLNIYNALTNTVPRRDL